MQFVIVRDEDEGVRVIDLELNRSEKVRGATAKPLQQSLVVEDIAVASFKAGLIRKAGLPAA